MPSASQPMPLDAAPEREASGGKRVVRGLRRLHDALLGRLSIGTKLLLAPAAAILGLAVVAGTAYYGLQQQQRTMERISAVGFSHLQLGMEANAFIQEAHFGLTRLLSAPQAEQNPVLIAASGEELLSKILSSIGTLEFLAKQPAMNGDEKQVIDATMGSAAAYQKMVSEALAQYGRGAGSAGLMLQTDSAFELLAWNMTRLVSLERRLTHEAFENSASRSRQLTLALAGMVVTAFLSALLVTLVVTRYIRRTVEAIREAASELSRGNLTRRAAVPSDDEIGQTARAFNYLVDELAGKMGELQVINGQLVKEMAERESVEKTLRESEERYRQLIEISPDAIMIERDGRISYVNSGTLRLFGAARADDIVGMPLAELLAEDHRAPMLEQMRRARDVRGEQPPIEGRMQRLDGAQIDIELTQSVFQYGGDTAIQTVVHDITKHKDYEEKLRRQAYYDTLTGLPNRTLLMGRLEQSIVQARRDGHAISVLFIDVDRFKIINDSLGHDVGDELLKTLAQRMSACVRQSDTLARLGGDEFVLLLGEANDEDVVHKLVQRLLTVVAQPMTLHDHEVSVTCSIGCAMFPEDGDDAITLLKHADTAMYRAKAEGRNNLRRYTSEMFIRVNERLVLETQLRHGIERHEFLLHYQPQVHLRSGKVIGSEALIRWQHPTMGLVSPAKFIPIAEETGMIVPLGEWVIRNACRQARAWQEEGLPLMPVTVNLSMQQLVLPELVPIVEHALRESKLPAKYLGLELTEHASMENPEMTVSILQKLQAIGVKIAIDDFGTGYSNLTYLKRFPIHRLKLDRSFVCDLARDRADLAIVQGMISIARGLKIEVMAEGIEEEEQLALLMAYGCDGMQGYYFSPPLPPEQFAELLREKRELVLPGAATQHKAMSWIETGTPMKYRQ